MASIYKAPTRGKPRVRLDKEESEEKAAAARSALERRARGLDASCDMCAFGNHKCVLYDKACFLGRIILLAIGMGG